MNNNRRNRKPELVAAATRLIAERGVRGTTIRAIAQAAGVTEGAIYRHYRTKSDLCIDIYRQIVQDMTRRKEHIVRSPGDFRDKLRAWVRVSYEYFDQYLASFTYVLLTQHEPNEGLETVATRQGRLFEAILQMAQANGRVRHLAPELAFSHFTGVMLNVPRLINEGKLTGPAMQYADEVAEAVWRMLQPGSEAPKQLTGQPLSQAGRVAPA